MLQLLVGGDVADWNISGSSIRKRVGEYLKKFEGLEVWLSADQLNALDEDNKQDLYSLLAIDSRIQLMSHTDLVALESGHLIACITNAGMSKLTFATRAEDALLFDEQWGNKDGDLLVRSSSFNAVLSGYVVDKNTLLPAPSLNVAEVVVTTELNGTLADFGHKFWELIQQKAPGVLDYFNEETVCALTYTDRYLASPLTVILFAQVVKSIPFAVAIDCTVGLHVLKAQLAKEQQHNRKIYANWQPHEDKIRESFIEKILECTSSECTVTMHDNPKDMSHSRSLKLSFDSGKQLVLRLDQGVGYWQDDNYPHPVFPFGNSISDQMVWVNSNMNRHRVRNGQMEPTYVFVKKVLRV